MKKFLAALCAALVFVPQISMGSETIIHDVKKDKLIKSGTIHISTKNIGAEVFTMELKYKIVAKLLFWERVLEGVKGVELPVRYLSAYGYEELEEQGQITDEKITVIHMGRKNLPNHYDCHVIKIVPKKETNWDGLFTYCQDIPSMGFARVKLNMREIPYVGAHTVYSRLRK
ncbi:MAG: hypothetical protein CME70_19675 [Halobacteriovorax sp.]|nr:hypothetical protein [Halobacteriovorax sp.]